MPTLVKSTERTPARECSRACYDAGVHAVVHAAGRAYVHHTETRHRDLSRLECPTVSEIIFEPMHVVGRRLHRCEVSSVDLVRAVLEQVERWGARINPFVTLTADLALEMARERDAELADGVDRGPLHGIPVVLKDLFQTAGIRTTGGSKALGNWVPEQDAMVVRLLRDAGAVFVGKTGMPEFATEPTSTNPTFGAVHNPWNLDLDTSGSSSGTGAAVAAGMAWCGPGSDTGGSIRMPAAACGLVGLKPTYGRVSLRGVLPLAASRDHIGPMARTVEDAALLMNVLAWYDEDDPLARDFPVDDYTDRISSAASPVCASRPSTTTVAKRFRRTSSMPSRRESDRSRMRARTSTRSTSPICWWHGRPTISSHPRCTRIMGICSTITPLSSRLACAKRSKKLEASVVRA